MQGATGARLPLARMYLCARLSYLCELTQPYVHHARRQRDPVVLGLPAARHLYRRSQQQGRGDDCRRGRGRDGSGWGAVAAASRHMRDCS
jgi:hypothetical protein